MSNLNLPSPEEFDIKIPVNMNHTRYVEGFQHGLESNTLTIAQMQLSFRMGFKAAKVYLRDLAIKNGTYQPQTYRCRTRVD